MKTLACLILLAVSALAGDLYQHINSGPIDIYVDSYAVHGEAGFPERHYVKVSVRTTDPNASLLIVDMRVLLADGSTAPVRFILDQPSARRELPGKPVKLTLLYVTRFHAQPTDLVISPEVR